MLNAQSIAKYLPGRLGMIRNALRVVIIQVNKHTLNMTKNKHIHLRTNNLVVLLGREINQRTIHKTCIIFCFA